MGYDTEYEGVLNFTKELTVEELRYLKSILGEDFREHPEWKESARVGTYLTYIDLVLTENWDGIKWDNRAEKTHDMIDAIALIKRLMEKKFDDKPFVLEGKFLCQGEDIEDRWFLMIDKEGYPWKQDISVAALITCPDCGCRFELGA